MADKSIVSLVVNYADKKLDLCLVSIKMGDTEITLRENFGKYEDEEDEY